MARATKSVTSSKPGKQRAGKGGGRRWGWGRRAAYGVLAVVAALAGLYATGLLVYHWDPTRVVVKRLAESDPHVYERIDPVLAARDPGKNTAINDRADAARIRDQLIYAIWGADGRPLDKLPVHIERDVLSADIEIDCPKYDDSRPLALSLDCVLDRYRGMANLAALERLHVKVHSGYTPQYAHFMPIRGNGRLVIYQHGYAGTYHMAHRHIERLVKAGYGVMATNLMGYGDNLSGDPVRFREHRLDTPRPMRYFYEPVVVALNYGLGKAGYKAADMIGFSMGGYITAVAAAMDPRIQRSYAVASPFPIFLREHAEAGPDISRYPDIVNAASLLDAYVLAGLGAGRGLTLIHNQFDRCCWGNRTATLVEPAVQNAIGRAGGGRFRVLIDTTHAWHKISRWAMDAILADMETP